MMFDSSLGTPNLKGKQVNKEDLLTQEKLKEIIKYDKDTGFLFWRKRKEVDKHAKMFNTRYSGNKIRNTCRNGIYLSGMVKW